VSRYAVPVLSTEKGRGDHEKGPDKGVPYCLVSFPSLPFLKYDLVNIFIIY